MGQLKFPPANISREYAFELFEALSRDVLYEPDEALFEEPDVYEKIRRDGHTSSQISHRVRQVAGPLWRLETVTDSKEDRAVATILTSLIKKIDNFAEARKNLAMAFLKGQTWAKISGQRNKVAIPGHGRYDWWCVTKLTDMDKRRFDLKPIDFQLNGKRKRKWRWRVATNMSEGPTWQFIKPRSYIHHKHGDEERGLGHGVGISTPLYLTLWYKQEVLKNGLQFLDRWSQGLVVWSIDQLSRAQLNNTARARAVSAKDVIDRMRAGNNIVKNKTDEIEIHDPPQGGWDSAEQALTYFDNIISRLILGAILPTGGNEGVGSLARAQVEDSTTQTLIEFDRKILAASISKHILQPLWDYNFPLFASLGLGEANMPTFVIDPGKEHKPAERVEVITKAVEKMPGLKSRISLQTVSEQLAIPLAHSDTGEETLADLEAATPAGETEDQGQGQPSIATQSPAMGQVSSAIDLVKSVQAGEVNPSSAIELLQAFFGIPLEQASKIILPASKAKTAVQKIPERSQLKEAA